HLKRRASVVAGAALAVAVGCAGCSQRPSDVYQGYVEGEFVYLASSQPGSLTQLAVARGQTVAADAPVFALESQNETDAVAQARQQLQAARAQQADLQTGKRRAEISVIEAQLAQARADATRAQTQLTRDEEQLQAGGIPKSQLDDSR